jgi:hypothetical protein
MLVGAGIQDGFGTKSDVRSYGMVWSERRTGLLMSARCAGMNTLGQAERPSSAMYESRPCPSIVEGCIRCLD